MVDATYIHYRNLGIPRQAKLQQCQLSTLTGLIKRSEFISLGWLGKPNISATFISDVIQNFCLLCTLTHLTSLESNIPKSLAVCKIVWKYTNMDNNYEKMIVLTTLICVRAYLDLSTVSLLATVPLVMPKHANTISNICRSIHFYWAHS